MTDHELTLMYLLKILGPTGRQMLKDSMMGRVATEPEAGKLLQAINKLERGLGQLDRMTDEDRRKCGIPTKVVTP